MKYVKVDKAFVTEASMQTIRDLKLQTGVNFKISQAVPGEHDKGLGMIEGTGRWRQEVAQANMDRLSQWRADRRRVEIFVVPRTATLSGCW